MSYTYNTSSRTSSQNSIYDYPEHLNPFYEDENHKRLRFWQFGGHRSDKPKSERRGSLVSIRDGLRDMWEFKTFRLKKKRSSSLGINKTSESPPPLRRDEVQAHYNTISNASAYRNTINTVGYSQSNTSTPLFQRNSRYRGSLQNQSQQNGIGLNRNDRYRSTIQNGFATYGGGGSGMVTSTPRSRYNATTVAGRGMTAGVSQSSLKSTNPFEDDDGDDNVSLAESFISTNGTVRQSLRPRKKRRAPPPPVPVRSVNSNQEQSQTSLLSTSLKIEESTEDPEDVRKLANLTTEIESFVQSTSNDDVSVPTTEHCKIEAPLPSSNDDNNNQLRDQEAPLKVEANIKIEHRTSESSDDINDSLNTQQVIKETNPTEYHQFIVTTSHTVPEPVEEMYFIERLEVIDEQPILIAPHPSPRGKRSPPPLPPPPPIEELDLENVALPETPVPARRQNKNRVKSNNNNAPDVLKITESSDSVTTTTTEEEDNMDSKAIKNVNYEFQYKVSPIQTEIDEKIITARLKISESTNDINSLPSNGTERRRSVRDIIESINKSQSLLKPKFDSSGALYATQSNDNVHRNMRELQERENELHHLLREMDTNLNEETTQRKPNPLARARGSYYDNVPEIDENNDNLDNENKAEYRIKKSPTKSLGIEQSDDGQFQDCIDWNPLPKPRRSRHFPEPVNQYGTATNNILTAIDQNYHTNSSNSS